MSLALLNGVSCSDNVPCSVKKTGEAMDEIAKGLEEFGSASVSSPVLASPNDRFKFELNDLTAMQLYNDARSDVQGKAADLEQVYNSLSLGASAQFDPTVAMAYVNSLQQFRQQQGLADQTAAVAARQREIKQRAAFTEYEGAIAKANQEKDAAKRMQMIADAERKYADALPSPNATAPTFPTDEKQSLPEVPKDLAKPATTGPLVKEGKFYEPQGLYKSTATPTVANRTAIITAAGDNATKAIFQTLGDPKVGAQFADKKVLFGVVMVAVNPGWKTRKNYTVDVCVMPSYVYKPARMEVVKNYIKSHKGDEAIKNTLKQDYHLGDVKQGAKLFGHSDPLGSAGLEGEPSDERPCPLVAAVSPMTETQVLDLESSKRRQEELALSLSAALRAAGMGAQAQAFENFVRSRQRDVATRDSDVVVNTYSHSGGMFGFQVGPRLRALEEPTTNRNARPALTLERQSFPSLVVFGFDAHEITPKVVRKCDRLWLYEPELQMRTVAFWNPLSDGMFPPGRFDRLTEARRLQWAWDLREANSTLDRSDTSLKGFYELIDTRSQVLKFKALGGATGSFLPIQFVSPPPDTPKQPGITAAFPSSVKLSSDASGPEAKDVVMVLLGKNLSQVDRDRISIVGDPSDTATVQRKDTGESDGSIVIKLTIKNGDAPVVLQFPMKKPGPPLFYPVGVTVAAADVDQPNLVIKRKVLSTRPGITIDRLEFSPDVPDELVKREIEKSKPHGGNANVDVNVNANEHHTPAASGASQK
jgi:hypothetical protein